MNLQPSSDHPSGLFVSVDGPSGAGKTTIVHHLAQLLVAAGKGVHVTAEPSTGPIGRLAAELTETVAGHAWPACTRRIATTTWRRRSAPSWGPGIS